MYPLAHSNNNSFYELSVFFFVNFCAYMWPIIIIEKEPINICHIYPYCVLMVHNRKIVKIIMVNCNWHEILFNGSIKNNIQHSIMSIKSIILHHNWIDFYSYVIRTQYRIIKKMNDGFVTNIGAKLHLTALLKYIILTF